MVPAALIPYVLEEHDFTLQDLLEHLSSKIRAECTLAESRDWRGPVQEVRVATRKPLSIRIEKNPDIVNDDLDYLAEDGEGVLPNEWIDILLDRVTARIEVGEADWTPPEPDENGRIEMDTVSAIDPTRPEVRAVLLEIARFVDGYVYDDVNEEWMVP